MTKIFEDLELRRSRYGLSKEAVLTEEEVIELVEASVQHTPSAFNAQTQRAVVLFGKHSDTFWDLTREALRKIAPEEGFENTVTKLESFKQGQGTILYYIDTDVVKGLQDQFALYADNFPIWAEQENGMMQLVTWTALAGAGIGASVQHYNPLVDASAAEAFEIPSSWKLVAQMPFGKAIDEVQPKTLQDVKGKVKVFK
ncbi:nitroreductase family protein [Erysipelothrix rhusiopathiae]|uniref:nitroreductase family protein n=1 Tax=Erysipelothrix rhusiopathiae TaxID=1648 RepID=UPI000E040E98|nr:nitroreductase family protein [Erysipelothrix rhusiopathiae]MDE8032981.1 nitroreductase family protein [Erysipelothrix rhusiopathiae]MDE8036431.1 nitroreductase family protein [Erysipelothrix rhusiopathiae]MDE8038647.1 nitroreductase family protein [Erysipelothrix rhusiopathiae]MDE8040215.1 nitroreductase family protein [Erysipelothrix rhusiopathiae]MDE8041908.1 nitroreductase family protein [Erysipelothrix rhusiopathiae]